MTEKPPSQRSSLLSQRAARSFTRRTVPKAAAAGGALAGLGPFVLPRSALSSSGEVNLYAWSDYVYPEMLESFEKQTGIKPNLSTYGTNDEVLNKLRAAKGEGFDIVLPSITYTPVWVDQKLLQPLDETKIKVDAVIPAMWESSKSLGAIHEGKRYAAPFNWGTEAIAYDTEAVKGNYGEISYGTLWAPEVKGKVTVRPHSVLLGIGLYLDASGKMPSNRMRDTYAEEAKMRSVYDECMKFALEHKDWIVQFWTNAQETQAAFKQNGAVIGQTWDGPAMRMRTETKGKITYLAPKEGALTWMDSLAIPVGAKNIEQAYAWLNWYYSAENAAIHVRLSGYNSTVAGADKFAGTAYAENFAAAYPSNAIENLWWYPPESTWFVAVRNEYRDKMLAS